MRQLVSNDQSFLFMNQIKGTPANWKKLPRRHFNNGKTIKGSKIVLRLSCADLRWNELVEVISKCTCLGLSLEDIERFNCF